MMNTQTARGAMNYDPTDQTSFPYQRQDPPFSAADLVPDPDSVDAAMNGTLDFDYMIEFMQTDRWVTEDPSNAFLIWDMALRLFRAMTNDPQNAYEGLAYPDLFIVALDTSIIWAVG